jgi:quinate dehydrogenase (quinone)
MNWGSVSVDPTNNLMFVNDMRLGLANYMVPRENVAKNASGIEMGIVPMDGTPFGAMRERFLSPLGIPCQKPPFGTMSAIDLTSGKIVWQVPVGTVQDTGPLGIRMHMPIPVGMPTLGASLSTQSGLLPAPRISTCARLIPQRVKRSGKIVCRSAASLAR